MCSLPHRQLRKLVSLVVAFTMRSLTHRQLRNWPCAAAGCPSGSLPHRQLRNIAAHKNPNPQRSLPHRRLRKRTLDLIQRTARSLAHRPSASPWACRLRRAQCLPPSPAVCESCQRDGWIGHPSPLSGWRTLDRCIYGRQSTGPVHRSLLPTARLRQRGQVNHGACHHADMWRRVPGTCTKPTGYGHQLQICP